MKKEEHLKIVYKAVNVKLGTLWANERKITTFSGGNAHGETYAVYATADPSSFGPIDPTKPTSVSMSVLIGYVRAYYGIWPNGQKPTKRWLTFDVKKKRTTRNPQHTRKDCFE